MVILFSYSLHAYRVWAEIDRRPAGGGGGGDEFGVAAQTARHTDPRPPLIALKSRENVLDSSAQRSSNCSFHKIDPLPLFSMIMRKFTTR